MPLLADRVKESTTTTGTGTIALAGAPAGFQSFNTAFANGATVYYVIQGGAEWEIGIGTVGTGTLARTQVLQSSNADALVPFSAGVKDVFVSYVADRAVTTSDAATLTNKTLDDYTNTVGANHTQFKIKANENLTKGDVVKAVGYNPGEDAIEVVKTVAASDLALGFADATLTTGQFGTAIIIGELENVNTNGFSVNQIIYSNGSGGFTGTKPSSGLYQPIGWIVRANSSTGVIAINIVAPLTVEASTNTANTVVLRDGSGDFSAGTITATAVNATTLDLTNLEVTNIKAKDGTQAIAIADSTGKLTISDGVLLSGLTASQAVFTDASKNLVSNAITGTGNVVMSASPTLTGTVTAATLNATTLGGTLSTAAQTNVTSVGTLSSLTVSGNVTVDTNTLFVDATNNRVGIGTASPNTRLEIADAVAGAPVVRLSGFSGSDNTAYATIQFYNEDGSGQGPNVAASIKALTASNGDASGGFLSFSTSSGTGSEGAEATEQMRLTSTGLGVGTTPLYKLDVYGGASGTRTDIYARNAAANMSMGVLTDNNGYLASTNATIFYTAAAERARIDASGNLGLGVTPSAWNSGQRAFHIGGAGSLRYEASGLGTMGVNNNAYFTQGGQWTYIANGNASRYEQVSGTHAWSTAPSGTAGAAISFTQAMTLDASGNVLVGAMSSPGTLNKQLVINSGASSLAGVIMQNNATGTGSTDGSGLYISGTTLVLQNFENDELLFNTNGTNQARITNTGNFGINNTAPSYKLQVNQTSGADRNIFAAQVTGASNGFEVKWNHSTTKTHIIITDIPTSSAGLPAGTLWSDGGTIKIA
jgi:hypothetical protein